MDEGVGESHRSGVGNSEKDEQDAHGNGDKPSPELGVLFRRAIARRSSEKIP